jgi:hypothetical protein
VSVAYPAGRNSAGTTLAIEVASTADFFHLGRLLASNV